MLRAGMQTLVTEQMRRRAGLERPKLAKRRRKRPKNERTLETFGKALVLKRSQKRFRTAGNLKVKLEL